MGAKTIQSYPYSGKNIDIADDLHVDLFLSAGHTTNF